MKLVKCVATRFVEMEICITRGTSKWYLKKISELNYFCKDMHCNLTIYSEKFSGRGIDIGGGVRAVLLDAVLLINDSTYRPSFTCHNTVLVELTEAHLKSSECASSFEKDETEEEFLRGVSNNCVLRARLKQSLSNTCCTQKRYNARYVVIAAWVSETRMNSLRCKR